MSPDLHAGILSLEQREALDKIAAAFPCVVVIYRTSLIETPTAPLCGHASKGPVHDVIAITSLMFAQVLRAAGQAVLVTPVRQ
jgi:hypothetical protein